jgi:O-antigen ligase
VSIFLGAFKVTLPLGSLDLNLNITQIVFITFMFFFPFFRSRDFLKFFSLKEWPSKWIVLYFLSNLFSSLFVAHTTASIKGSLVILVYAGIYFLARYLANYYTGLQYALKNLFYYNRLSVLFGVGCMFFYLAFKPGPLIGVATGHLTTGFPSIRSLSFEPNTFAISTASMLCLIIAQSLYTRRLSKLGRGWLILVGISVVFAFTRSVYLALPFAGFFMVWLSGKIPITKVFVGVSLVVLLLSVYVAFSDKNIVVTSFASKLNNPFDQESGSVSGRLDAYATGINGFLKSPIIGNGTLSADTQILDQYTKEYKDQNGSSGWLTGFWIQSLNDTGVVGLLIGLAMLISFIRVNYICFKIERESLFRRSLYLGFMAAAIVVAICTQISNVLWVSFTFVFWGINMALVKQVNQKEVINEKIKFPAV